MNPLDANWAHHRCIELDSQLELAREEAHALRALSDRWRRLVEKLVSGRHDEDCFDKNTTTCSQCNVEDEALAALGVRK